MVWQILYVIKYILQINMLVWNSEKAQFAISTKALPIVVVKITNT